MASNTLSKSSKYVQSLVDFIKDTKPYHSKLTEIVEEYQFFDNMNVHFDERLLIKTKISANWVYNYFSGANPLFRTMPAQRMVMPAYLRAAFTAGADENTDLALVPHAFSKKTFDGIGINAAFVRRGTHTEPMTESVDWFESHGSYQFQIKQTYDAGGAINQLYSATMDDGTIAEAVAITRQNALNTANPNSAVNQIRVQIDAVQAATNLVVPHNTDVQAALDAIYGYLNTPDLPPSYEDLIAYLTAVVGTPQQIMAQSQINALAITLDNLSPALYFNDFVGVENTESNLRMSGALFYRTATNDYLRVSNITADPNSSYEEWSLTVTDEDLQKYAVTGSTSGFIGFFFAGSPFTTDRLSFTSTRLLDVNSDPAVAPLGTVLLLTPGNKIVIAPTAPLETWNIIKVNPIAHDRPLLSSTTYGGITDLSNNLGKVTLLDSSIPTSNIVLTARAGGQIFDLSSDSEPSYSPAITVGAVFNDGRLGFRILPATYHEGDRFYITIENLPAQIQDLDLGYGYDLDSMDTGDTLVYNNTDTAHPDYNRKIEFNYDGRFTDYNLNALNLTLAQNAVNGRRWRVRALPSATAIATLKKDGSGLNSRVDLQEGTSGIAPDVPANAPPLYSMAGDASTAADLFLYYATNFAVEYFNPATNAYVSIGNVAVGGSFTSALHGISFTLPAGSKPFIAASSDDGLAQPRVEGGDVFSWTVVNPEPTIVELPIGLTSPWIPRLNMHSDGFFNVPAARWVVAFTSPDSYTVSGTLLNGQPVPGSPLSGTLSTGSLITREGNSFRGLNLHFTVVPVGGLKAGDSFTFNTFEHKPTYLVHGSVSGWDGRAEVGQYFWNGKIGFKITPPHAHLYKNGLLIEDPSTEGISIDRLREDSVASVYTIRNVAGQFMVSNDLYGDIGHVSPTGTFSSTLLDLTLDNPPGAEYRLEIFDHPYELFNGQDLVILNPVSPARLPLQGEKVIVEKTEFGHVGISLTPGSANTSPLAPITIDQRFIDLDTNSSIPLSATSPETSILQGWLPMERKSWDSGTSIAEFSDPAIRHTFSSAASGEAIGELRMQTTDIDEPIIFEWDENFFNTYMPLNAEANVLVTGTGWDDKVRVHMTESVKFLIAGGGLPEDWMFQDTININIAEDTFMDVKMGGPLLPGGVDVPGYQGSISVTIEDTFDGFLPGWDNLEYDNEPVGYDEGQPPDIYSLLSKANLTADEENDILRRWNFYLEDGEVPTTEQQWAYLRQQLALDPNPGGTAIHIGLPRRGLGIDVNVNPEGHTSASIQEAMSILANEFGNLHDSRGYDIGRVDVQPDTIVTIYSGSLPPVPPSVPPGSTYDTLDTPLYAAAPARVFEISFATVPSTTPVFQLWLPGSTAGVQVPVVERVSSRTYRFSVAQATEAKITVG